MEVVHVYCQFLHVSFVQEWVPIALNGGVVRVPPLPQLRRLDTRGGSQERHMSTDFLGRQVLHRHNSAVAIHCRKENTPSEATWWGQVVTPQID